MRTALLSLFCFLCCAPSFAQTDTLKALVDQGVALNDKGDYEGALRAYDAVISQSPQYYLAYAEKTTSLCVAGRYQESIDLCKLVLKKYPGNEQNGMIYVNYGTSLDALKQPDEALKIYKEGIKKYPDLYLLPFNKGVTEYNQKNYPDAISDLKRAVILKPEHASCHQALAACIAGENKMAAVLALSTFLLWEPEGKRAEKNLKLMLQLLGGNVQQKDEKNISISLSSQDLDTKGRGEDNFHYAELMISLRSALDYDSAYKKLPLAEGLKEKLSMLIPTDGVGGKRKGFFMHFYIPFLEDMRNDSLLETACYIIYTSAGNPANNQWLTDNKDKVDRFNQWLSAYRWAKE